MADEVEAVLPQAVVMHPDGYKMVDYALLGIDSRIKLFIESSARVKS